MRKLLSDKDKDDPRGRLGPSQADNSLSPKFPNIRGFHTTSAQVVTKQLTYTHFPSTVVDRMKEFEHIPWARQCGESRRIAAIIYHPENRAKPNLTFIFRCWRTRRGTKNRCKESVEGWRARTSQCRDFILLEWGNWDSLNPPYEW